MSVKSIQGLRWIDVTDCCYKMHSHASPNAIYNITYYTNEKQFCHKS